MLAIPDAWRAVDETTAPEPAEVAVMGVLRYLNDHSTMTMVMQTVSKSQFKARALEFFREVERTGQDLVITDRGKPVLKLTPYRSEEHTSELQSH